MPSSNKKPTALGLVMQHLIVFLVCMIFPGLTTMIAPASWIHFSRDGEAVHCTARTCAYFVIPFKTQTVARVKDFSSREREGRTERKKRHGHATSQQVHVDGEGFLQIHGTDGQLVEISVSPVSLTGVLDRSNEFLNTASKNSMTLFVIANWKFGAVMGGVLTLFTLLYVVGYSLSFLRFLVVGLKRLFP